MYVHEHLHLEYSYEYIARARALSVGILVHSGVHVRSFVLVLVFHQVQLSCRGAGRTHMQFASYVYIKRCIYLLDGPPIEDSISPQASVIHLRSVCNLLCFGTRLYHPPNHARQYILQPSVVPRLFLRARDPRCRVPSSPATTCVAVWKRDNATCAYASRCARFSQLTERQQ